MKCIRMLLNGYQRTIKIKRNIIRIEKLEQTEKKWKYKESMINGLLMYNWNINKIWWNYYRYDIKNRGR